MLLTVALLAGSGELAVRHIFIINGIVGFMNAFQFPAETVAVGILVPPEKYSQASGLNSFTSSLLTVVTPVMAAAISSFAGLNGVIVFDWQPFCLHLPFCCS